MSCKNRYNSHLDRARIAKAIQISHHDEYSLLGGHMTVQDTYTHQPRTADFVPDERVK